MSPEDLSSTEQTKLPGKTQFMLVWAVMGLLIASLTILMDRRRGRYIGTPTMVVARFGVSAAVGALYGLCLRWKMHKFPGRTIRIFERINPRFRFVLFLGLMLGLACLLWFWT